VILTSHRRIPMLHQDLEQALNNQVNAEFYSAYFYLSMSTYAEQQGYKGASWWLFCQFHEEMTHALHMQTYILSRGGTCSYSAIEVPPTEFTGLIDVFNQVLEHEQKVTTMINDIASLAMQHQDHALYQFIMWYVSEQVEEEEHVSDVLQRMRLIGENTSMLLQYDAELATRVFANPFPTDVKMI